MLIVLIDIKDKIKECFNSAAVTYRDAAFIQLKSGKELLEELNNFELTPHVVADIGSGIGCLTKQLAAKYPASRIIQVDFAQEMLNEAIRHQNFNNIFYMNSDFDYLPFIQESVDLVFSNFSLQWSLDISKTFLELYRVLKPNGYCLFTTLGPTTLFELRNCWQLIDSDSHTNHHDSVECIINYLNASKFKIIEIKSSIKTAHFINFIDILHNLKAVGANCVINKKANSLMGKSVLRQLAEHYEQYRDANGKLSLSYEVISVIAIK